MVTTQITKTFQDNGKLKASFDVYFNDYMTICDCKIFENENGRFCTLPKVPFKGSDGTTKYKDVLKINDELKGAIDKSALIEYDKQLQKNHEEWVLLQKEIEQTGEVTPWN